MCWWLYLVLLIGILLSWIVYLYNSGQISQNLKKNLTKGQRILFVVAHPDDECMFFGPAILACTKSTKKKRGVKPKVYVLCLSNGNHYGLGETRKKEFFDSCTILRVPEKNIFLEDSFRDNPTEMWDPAAISSVISGYSKRLKIDYIFTFDDYGVSGHLNHRALYRGIEQYSKNSGVLCFALESVGLLRKYLSFLDSLLTYFAGDWIFANYNDRTLIQEAMRAHKSQLVWFRRLYILFSRYMFYNNFKKI